MYALRRELNSFLFGFFFLFLFNFVMDFEINSGELYEEGCLCERVCHA